MVACMELIPFPQTGDTLQRVTNGGLKYAGIGMMCDNLGVNFSSQLFKLRHEENAHWAGVVMIATPDASGVLQNTWVMPIDSVAMWLATIRPSKVDKRIRDKLKDYQIHARNILADDVDRINRRAKLEVGSGKRSAEAGVDPIPWKHDQGVAR